MNIRVILRALGLFTAAAAVSMTAALVWAVMDGSSDQGPLLDGILFGLLLGFLLWFPNRRVTEEIKRRDAIVIVIFSWVLAALVGAIPFWLYPGDAFPSFVDAYFESMSGFTTTGASVLVQVEALPRGLLFWRSLTHWLGGMGIIVLFIAVLPSLGVSGRQLFRMEVAGLKKEGLTPRIQETARHLWLIYVGLTMVGTAVLHACGLNVFESLCETFGALATGGFSVRNASIASYDSFAVELVIMVLMVLGAVNFSLYWHGIRGNLSKIAKDVELRVYVGLVLALPLLLAGLREVSSFEVPPGRLLREAYFNGISILTCTGFATTNTNNWPDSARTLLLIMMVVGGCAGSTAGGLKVVRFVVLAKVFRRGILMVQRPNEVRSLRLGGMVLSEPLVLRVVHVSIAGLVVFIAASLALMGLGVDGMTSVSAVLANLCTAGPGFGLVGSTSNYSMLPSAGKVILIGCQIMGRLELMTVLVLFVPSFWQIRRTVPPQWRPQSQREVVVEDLG